MSEAMHNNQANPIEAQLLTLLDKQEQTVGRLRACATRQEALIEQGRSDELLELLTERQALIDDFTHTHGELGPLTVRVEEGHAALSDADRTKIRARIEQIASQLGEVLELDARGQTQLETARSHTREQLHSQNKATTAHRAYVASSQKVSVGHEGSLGSNRFADERG